MSLLATAHSFGIAACGLLLSLTVACAQSESSANTSDGGSSGITGIGAQGSAVSGGNGSLGGAAGALASGGVSAAGYAGADAIASGSAGVSGAPAGFELGVLTFNIRYGTADDGDDAWDLRKHMVFEVLRTQAADSLGLQEALNGQLREIDVAVSEYARVGVGRNDGKLAGEFSPILYKLKRLEVLTSGTFWLSETPEVPGSKSWGASHPRICTWAHLREKITGRAYFHYNVHFDHQSETAKTESAKLLMQRVAQRSPSTDPVIVTSDLNANETSPAFQYLLGAAAIGDVKNPVPLRDSFRELHPDAEQVGTAHGFSGRVDGAKIDYVFISSGVTALAAEIIRTNENGRYPSDHFPVSATLSIAASK
jgi:endonuclease/exonuclease/phosphatase family metal-dependent hydrolase